MNTVKKTFITVIGLALFAGAATSAFAHSRDHHGEAHAYRAHVAMRDSGINRHQVKQHEHIYQGVRSGQLTRGEANHLRAEQRSIHHEARHYKSDGMLTRAERRDLHQDQRAASRHIYTEKHDAIHR